MARLVALLRDAPETLGLSSSVSGFLTKSGFGVWSATPPSIPFRRIDVSDSAAADDHPRAVAVDHVGPASIAGWTVEHLAGEPHRAVVVADTPDGGRTIASTGESGTVAAMRSGRWVGRRVVVAADGSFLPA